MFQTERMEKVDEEVMFRLDRDGQTLGNGEPQGSLACCRQRGRKELDTT